MKYVCTKLTKTKGQKYWSRKDDQHITPEGYVQRTDMEFKPSPSWRIFQVTKTHNSRFGDSWDIRERKDSTVARLSPDTSSTWTTEQFACGEDLWVKGEFKRVE